MSNSTKIILLILSIFHGFCSISQTVVVNDAPIIPGTTVVIPGIEYKRSGYHNFFWGKHYRKEWVTPVRVINFYLDTAFGGLVPYQEGGGRQSKTLRLRTKNEKEYVLRSVNKDFGRALPEILRGTFLSKIAKDQVSIGHPFAGITITPMAKAAGIYHTTPIIVFVPAQPALGKYNEKYGNQLYLFEERPDENQEQAANFGFSKNLVGSDKLFKRLYKEDDNKVDSITFLRARLFDMFIGDWGRHPDNWRWAEFKTGDQKIYKPVPRDRDQAYTKIDGLWPGLAGFFYKPFQGFDATIKDVPAWNKHAQKLDRMFLTDIDKDIWLREAAFLQSVLTDSLIEQSIRQMPPEIFPISGNTIIARLKSRRDHLQEYAFSYYKHLDRYHRISIARGNKLKYDTTDHKERFDFSIRPFISSSVYKTFDRNPLQLFPRTGLKIVGSITYTSHPWKPAEEQTVHQICANYGFLRHTFNIGYVGRFAQAIGKWDIMLKARLDAPAVENYFGVGNNTTFDNKTSNYYRTFSTRGFGSVGVARVFNPKNQAEASFIFQSVKIRRSADHYITDVQGLLDPSVFTTKTFAGVEAGHTHTDADNRVFPTKGIGWRIGGGYLSDIKTGESFIKGSINIVTFLPLSRQFSLATRTGAGALSGDANYYHLHSIGGGGNGELRGYERERFYGKEFVYLNNDLRWLFDTKNYFFNGKAGLLTFYEVGRVWIPDETSTKWHSSYGFGAILVPFNKFAIAITYGISQESTRLNFKTSFLL